MRYFLLLCLIILLSNCNSPEQTAASYPFYRKLPYPKSELITGFTWDTLPSRYPGTGTDMHWWTIGRDSAVYVVDDDGANFNGPFNYAHVLKITGRPPKHTVETVTDFMDIPFRSMLPEGLLLRRYVDGTIAIDTNLYVAIYDYDWNLNRTKPYYDSLRYRMQFFDCWQNVNDSLMLQNMFFTDNLSRNYGIAGIIQSTDGGKTWSNVPNAKTPRFLGPHFAGLTFVNFGPGYTHVPESLGNYVYALSNDYSWESGDHLYMARVPKQRITDRTAWEFLSGFDKQRNPTWSAQEVDAFPVFTDSGHVGHPTISYNYALKRYILGIYSDTIPHRESASYEEWRRWDKASEVQLYESPNPWGPWRVFYAEMPFGGDNHSCYLPQIPNTWWNTDGTKGIVMFAGDYTGRNFEYYGLMTWPFTLTVKP